MSHYRTLLGIVCMAICGNLSAQELFVYTEPSSNMPAKSIGIRLSNWFAADDNASHINYHFFPEIMCGAHKRLMLHVEGYFSTVPGAFKANGGGVYLKYRFYSSDKVNRHFRLAAFGRATANNTPIRQEEIAVNGYNTGYQAGAIGTQLLHKTALSATAYYEQAFDNLHCHSLLPNQASNAVNYSLSAGKLLLPKAYTGYKQANMNIMAELLGQTLLSNGRQYADIAASLQFIFNSQTRIDIGYKHQLYSAMSRTAPNNLMIRVEHLLYNIL